LIAALETAVTSGEQPVSAIPGAWGRRPRVVPLALTVAVLIALAGGGWMWYLRRGAAPVAPPLVAVLPFETAGAAPDTAFADGLGDAITGKLARLQGLRVIDRASVRTIKDAALRPQAAGHDLGADYVLRATLRWARGADGEPRVQVSPVLVRVSDGTTKWAGEPTVVTPSDPFAAQGTLATEVAEALDVALAPAERAQLERPPTADTAAFAAEERGRRIWFSRAENGTQQDREQALREFETAYKLDPQYAEAYGMAAAALEWMAERGAPRVFYDSAAVLARRSLSIDPGEAAAASTLFWVAMQAGRPDQALQLAERAARAFPSSAALQGVLAEARYRTGDSAGAVDAVRRLAILSPRAARRLLGGAQIMIRLRRYDDARDLLARARALEPDAPAVQLVTFQLASATGDNSGANAAGRAFSAMGEVRGTRLLFLLQGFQFADAALLQELATASLDSSGARTARDSVDYFANKAELFLARGEAARGRALMDSGFRVATTWLAHLPDGSPDAAYASRYLAWLAAGRGDRAAAVAALRRGAADPLITHGRPGSDVDGNQTCTSAEVYGLLGDAEAVLPFLRRCLTMHNGYPLPRLGEPEFAPVRNDPRVRALAAELTAAQDRARRTPTREAP
jgi:TolB-like protein/Tfp pilus assembly protein PilF